MYSLERNILFFLLFCFLKQKNPHPFKFLKVQWPSKCSVAVGQQKPKTQQVTDQRNSMSSAFCKSSAWRGSQLDKPNHTTFRFPHFAGLFLSFWWYNVTSQKQQKWQSSLKKKTKFWNVSTKTGKKKKYRKFFSFASKTINIERKQFAKERTHWSGSTNEDQPLVFSWCYRSSVVLRRRQTYTQLIRKGSLHNWIVRPFQLEADKHNSRRIRNQYIWWKRISEKIWLSEEKNNPPKSLLQQEILTVLTQIKLKVSAPYIICAWFTNMYEPLEQYETKQWHQERSITKLTKNFCANNRHALSDERETWPNLSSPTLPQALHPRKFCSHHTVTPSNWSVVDKSDNQFQS